MQFEELLLLAENVSSRTLFSVAPFIMRRSVDGKYMGAMGGIHDKLQQQFTARLSGNRFEFADTLEELCDRLAARLVVIERLRLLTMDQSRSEAERAAAWNELF